MPGETDPSNASLPQQPLHVCLFPSYALASPFPCLARSLLLFLCCSFIMFACFSVPGPSRLSLDRPALMSSPSIASGLSHTHFCAFHFFHRTDRTNQQRQPSEQKAEKETRIGLFFCCLPSLLLFAVSSAYMLTGCLSVCCGVLGTSGQNISDLSKFTTGLSPIRVFYFSVSLLVFFPFCFPLCLLSLSCFSA